MLSGNGTLRVLLVEDDEGDAHLFRSTLPTTTVAGHATSLAEALAWLDEHRADVVALDLGLPDSVGLPTLQQLLEAHPDTPVVVLSGHDDDEQATAAVEVGAQEYLVKGSVDGHAMRRTLRHAVERHRLQTELSERVKEMFGLYAVTRELHTDQDLGTLLAAIAAHVREAMRWPAASRVEVGVDDATATAGPAGPARRTLTARVLLDGRQRGLLQVHHVEDLPFMLPFEQALLDAAAEAMEVWLSRQDAVRTLRGSEARLHGLVAQLPGLVWTTDADLRVTSAHGALLDALGVDIDTVIGAPITAMLEDPRGDTSGHLTAALTGTPATFDQQWRGRWWRNHMAPKRKADGSVVGVLCLSLDVTEEKTGAIELVETRARLQGIFDNASDAMVLIDDTGTYVDANRAACELTGYTIDQLVGMRGSDLTADDLGPEGNRSMWSDFLAAGSMTGEYALRRSDGRTVDVDFRAVTDVVPGLHLSVMHDITDRKRAAAALAASEARFRTMAEAAQDAVYRLRTVPGLAVEYLNPAATTISGFSTKDFRDNPSLYTERAHPDDLHLLAPEHLGCSTTRTVTVRFRHADGHWIWLEDSRSPIVEDGTIVGLQGVIRDVTSRERTQQALKGALESERRAAAQLRSADQLKSHFLQAVSHELRTPLTSVLGMAEMLVEQHARLSEEQLDYFQRRVLANAQRLDHLLADLLDLERLQHGAVRLEREDTDLGDLVHRVVDGIELGGRSLTIDAGAVAARVDPGRVERIVHNLLANAVKHTPPGTRISVHFDTDADGTTIEVADDGPGIPDDLALVVFEPFRQGPQAFAQASPGTGIGLSIVLQFAALHGGTVWVRPTPGGGATFTVRLPHAHDRELAHPTHPTQPTHATRHRPVEPAAAVVAAHGLEPGDAERRGRDASAITAWATRELLTVSSRQEIVGVLLRAVHELGGWTVPASVADQDHALPLDISLGTSEPLLPAAQPATVERLLLERHLPELVADARHTADTLDGTVHRLPATPTHGPDRHRFARLHGRLRRGDIIVALELEGPHAENAGTNTADAESAVRAFAAGLKAQLRGSDEAAVLGDGQFAALLRDTDADGATALLERLRERWERERPRSVDFHAGIARHADGPAAVDAAHRALERARRAGAGSQWHVHSPGANA